MKDFFKLLGLVFVILVVCTIFLSFMFLVNEVRIYLQSSDYQVEVQRERLERVFSFSSPAERACRREFLKTHTSLDADAKAYCKQQ